MAPGAPLKDPAKRINRVKPVRGEWVDLAPLAKPVLDPYPTDWFRKDARAWAIPKWIWDLWRQDPVTSQWSPGDHAQALELGRNYYALKPELRFKIQTALGLNSAGRRSLRWRNGAETESAVKAEEHAREARRLRIVKPEEAEVVAATTTAFETEIVAFPSTERGLCAGPAYRLRRAYLDGMTDPAAHTYALVNPDYVDALARNSKTASFAAIAAMTVAQYATAYLEPKVSGGVIVAPVIADGYSRGTVAGALYELAAQFSNGNNNAMAYMQVTPPRLIKPIEDVALRYANPAILSDFQGITGFTTTDFIDVPVSMVGMVAGQSLLWNTTNSRFEPGSLG